MGRPTKENSLSRQDVIVAAIACVDREGASALGVSRVARELGIKPPAIYKHLESGAALQKAVVLELWQHYLVECQQTIALQFQFLRLAETIGTLRSQLCQNLSGSCSTHDAGATPAKQSRSGEDHPAIPQLSPSNPGCLRPYRCPTDRCDADGKCSDLWLHHDQTGRINDVRTLYG